MSSDFYLFDINWGKVDLIFFYFLVIFHFPVLDLNSSFCSAQGKVLEVVFCSLEWIFLNIKSRILNVIVSGLFRLMVL